MQLPRDIHRAAALVLDIIGKPQKRIWWSFAEKVLLVFPDKQQYLVAGLTVMDIALPGSGLIRSGALALPVKQALIDRVRLFLTAG